MVKAFLRSPCQMASISSELMCFLLLQSQNKDLITLLSLLRNWSYVNLYHIEYKRCDAYISQKQYTARLHL